MSQVVDSLEAARGAAALSPGGRRTRPTRRPATRSLLPRTSSSSPSPPGGPGSSTRRSACGSARTPRTRPPATCAARRGWRSRSWDYEGRGSFSVANGWFATGQRLLAGVPESPEHGRALLTEALLRSSPRETSSAPRRCSTTRSRSPSVSATGMSRCWPSQGAAARTSRPGGSTRASRSSTRPASAISGDLKPHSTGLVYCLTISSCRDLGDYRRAAEWTEAANQWCDRLDVSGFPGACRIHRAEVLRLRGDWTAAEAQAVAACEELADFDRSITAGGHYEIGEIRRRRGDFAGAEEAYRTADELVAARSPGSRSCASRRKRSMRPWPGSPAPSRTRRSPCSASGTFRQVEIALAAGDLRTARAALRHSRASSTRTRSATAARVRCLDQPRSRPDRARREGLGRRHDEPRRARDEWQGVGAPYRAAEARMLLGIAYRRRGDEHDGRRARGARSPPSSGSGPARRRAAKELLGRLETRRTFLFTDIVDSTRLLETLGDDKWKRLLAARRAVRERIVESGGEVVKRTGDGFFASFDNPKAAIAAAVAIQRALDAEIVAPDVRIGAHSGAGS